MAQFYAVPLGDDRAASSTQYPRILTNAMEPLYRSRYVRPGKVCWVRCGVRNTLPRLREPQLEIPQILGESGQEVSAWGCHGG